MPILDSGTLQIIAALFAVAVSTVVLVLVSRLRGNQNLPPQHLVWAFSPQAITKAFRSLVDKEILTTKIYSTGNIILTTNAEWFHSQRALDLQRGYSRIRGYIAQRRAHELNNSEEFRLFAKAANIPRQQMVEWTAKECQQMLLKWGVRGGAVDLALTFKKMIIQIVARLYLDREDPKVVCDAYFKYRYSKNHSERVAGKKEFADVVLKLAGARIQKYAEMTETDAFWFDSVISSSYNKDKNTLNTSRIVDAATSLLHNLTESVATPLTNTVYFLNNVPEHLKDVQTMIQDATKSSSEVTVALLDQLKLEPYIMETLRLTDTAIAVRNAVTSIKYGSYQIPPGSEVAFSHEALHMHPSCFPAPQVFKPLRSTRSSNVSSPTNPTTEDEDPKESKPLLEQMPRYAPNLAFGWGKHPCPGKQLSLDMIKIVLITLISQYNIGITPTSRVDNTNERNVSPSQEQPQQWVLEGRYRVLAQPIDLGYTKRQ